MSPPGRGQQKQAATLESREERAHVDSSPITDQSLVKALPYSEVPVQRTQPMYRSETATMKMVKEPSRSPRTSAEDRENTLRVLEEIWNQPQKIAFGDLMKLSPRTRALTSSLLRKNKVPRGTDNRLELRETVIQLLENINNQLGLPTETLEDDLLVMWDKARGKGEHQQQDKPLNTQPIEVLLQDLKLPAAYASKGEEDVPAGGMVCPDPVEIYLIENSGALVSGTVVASTAAPIRTIYPCVNRTVVEENVIDGGSQVCSASEEAAREAGITWDPEITISLQSANLSKSSSLGLARNVPVDCGNGVVAYVQFHIVKTAAYKFLLGRPFSIAMGLKEDSHTDGSHTIQLRDPNNGQAVILPTYARGARPSGKQNTSAF